MIIRVSERGTFKRCRRRWDYSSPNRQNLTTASSPVYLTFGTLIHSTLEAWAGKPEANVEELYLFEARKQVDEMKTRYRQVVGTEPSEDEVGVLYDAIDMGRSMVSAYASRWGSSIPDEYNIVQLEQTFLIDVPGTPHQLQGTLDGLLQNKKTGEIVILERKTYGSRPRLDSLDHNDQFLAYMWAVQQLTGQPCGGILYDGLWKRKLEGKRTLEDMTMRTLLKRSQAEIEEFGRLLVREVNDMANDPQIYLNRRWEGCYDCSFVKLCNAESKGEDIELVKASSYRVNLQLDEDENDFTATSDQ